MTGLQSPPSPDGTGRATNPPAPSLPAFVSDNSRTEQKKGQLAPARSVGGLNLTRNKKPRVGRHKLRGAGGLRNPKPVPSRTLCRPLSQVRLTPAGLNSGSI